MGKKFLKGIFLGGNFREHVLEEKILLGRKFCQQNVWRISCELNVIREKKRILGSKNVLEERYGEQKKFESKLLSLMVSP